MGIRRTGSSRWLAGAAVGISTVAGAGKASAVGVPAALSPSIFQDQLGLADYNFGYDGVLGTSMDLIVRASSPEQAEECQRVVLAEIERLRQILSTYDPASEISRYKSGLSPIKSSELADLLAVYEIWSTKTGGAIDVNMGEVIRLWKQTGSMGRLPTASELRDARNVPSALNVDALGKGYIIDRAVELARRVAPAGLLNIGGDIRVWGDRTWQIGVADPGNPSDNAPALGYFPLRNAAVATSGDYARFQLIHSKRYSHIIDPRTLWPVEDVTGTTVVAPDCVTANALSTAASVLGMDAGHRLIESFEIPGHVLIDGQSRTRGAGLLAQMQTGAPAAKPAAPKPVQLADANASAQWPADFQMSIGVALKNMSPPGRGPSRGTTRAYVAVWIEDAKHNLVRTIAVWGDKPRWTRELSYWWKTVENPEYAASTITRATRPPGEYMVTWDGKDEKGKVVPQGEYTVFLEINREHGQHGFQSVVIKCGDASQSASIKATVESNVSKIEYGPRKQAAAE